MKLNQCVFRSLLMAGLVLTSLFVSARTITGTVTDQTGETIISASVIVKGTTLGTVTDFDGNYELDVPEDASVLVFSYIGLETQELPISGNVMNVVLKENSEVLEEVVVTGYGTTKKRDLVTSVASVGADQLKDIPVTSASEVLQGKLAGVSVTTTEGSPDADVKIRVRGGTSLTQSSDPLYIVDGFQVSSISDIAPGDIQSMDVLKDAAATAIYGAQGANGVIIITTKETKSDSEDKMQIHLDYTGYMGWKQVSHRYEMLNMTEFTKMQYETAYLIGGPDKLADNFNKYFDPAYQTGGKDAAVALPQGLPGIIDFWNDNTTNPYTDWQTTTFGNNGLNSNHNISISGGNKKANFNFSYNRIDDAGIMYGSDYNRNNLNLKTKFQPLKGLTLALNVRYSNTNVLGAGTNTADQAGSSTESRVRDAIGYSPVELYNMHADAEEETSGSSKNIYDPITTINDNYKTKTDNKLNLGGYIQYKFLKDFTLKAAIEYQNRTLKQDRYYGPSTFYSRQGDGATGANQQYLGHAIATNQSSSRLQQTNTFEYAHKWNSAHNFSWLLGEEISIQKQELRTNKYFGFDAKMAGKDVMNYLGLAKAYSNSNYIDPNDNMLSFFTRLNYDYMGRYYVTATFRADASTRFAKENQWGFFPSVALAWRIIDEEWMEPAQEVMSNFKIRASYGSVGNNNVNLGYLSFDYLATPTLYTDIFSNMLTVGGNSKEVIAANSLLKWETTITRDLGVDLGFLNERLTITLDGYCNSTKDLILKYALATGGYTSQYRNIGSTENQGFEFSVNGVILDHKSKSLSYGLTLGANLSLNRNRVKDLGGMDEYKVSVGCLSSYYSGTEYILHKGDLVGDIYGYETDGFWTPADFEGGYNVKTRQWLGADGNPVSTKFGNAYPGMTKLAGEFDEEGKYQENDVKVLGNALPKFNGGFNLSFYISGEEWGKIDASANFTYSYGNDVLNFSALDYSTIVGSNVLRNNSAALTDRYSMFDKDSKYIPADYADYAVKNVIAANSEGYQLMSAELAERNQNATVANPYASSLVLTDKFVEDASFLRLSSLTIGYSLPTKYINKAYIQNLRFFFTASNLFCATKYSGADPEVDTRSKNNPLTVGVDYSAFPKSRAFNFGLNLSF